MLCVQSASIRAGFGFSFFYHQQDDLSQILIDLPTGSQQRCFGVRNVARTAGQSLCRDVAGAALTLPSWRGTFSAAFRRRGRMRARDAEEGAMVKYIAVTSYWIGVVCAMVSVIARICDALGIVFVHILTRGNNIDFRSFLDAGLLFLFIAIASANYASFQAQQRKS